MTPQRLTQIEAAAMYVAVVSGMVLIPSLLAPTLAYAMQEGANAVGAQGIVTPGQANENMVSLVWAYAASAFLEWWKKSRFAGFNDEMSLWAKRAVAWMMALAGAIGVHGSFDAATGTLTITGLLIPDFWTAVGDTLRQFVLQQITYRAAIETTPASTWTVTGTGVVSGASTSS